MDQSVGFSVLVVDNDVRSLANLVKILVGWKYKVLTANNAHHALETLREFEGFFDVIITEFHMPGMDDFEFQKCIKDEFNLPIIMVSKDNRKDVISKSLQNGVALYILKPFSANDFKDIWKYATTSSNEKPFCAKDLTSGEGESSSQNVNSLTTSASSPNEPMGNRKYCKRKTQDDQDNNEGRSNLSKKPKVNWDINLHNLFLNAIHQIGVEKAVPKKIVEVMNIPHLTRQNVASHLQKYRLFLKKVVGKGMVEGLSNRALRSKFATSLPNAMIHDIQERYEKQHDPLYKQSYYTNPYSKVVTCLLDQKASTNNSYVSTTQHGRSQFPYYSGLLNQVLDEKSGLGRNIENTYNFSNSDMLSTYGEGHRLMTSQNSLSEDLNLKHGCPLYQNYGSMGNNNFSHGLGSCSMESLSNSNILSQTSTYHHNNNFSRIQLDNGSLMSSSVNNNSSGFINGTQNEIINVSSLRNENFGLLQGGFGSQFVSDVGSGSGSELPATLITTGNSSGVTEMPQHKLDDNVVGNDQQQFINASSTTETEVNPMEEDPSDIFFMLDDMDLFKDLMEENNNLIASEFSNVEFSNSCDVVQPLEQVNGAEHVTIPPTNITSNLSDVSPTNSEQKFNELQCSDIFPKSNTSTIDWEFDMDKFEAFFGTIDD